MLVAIPSPVRKIDTSSGGTVICWSPRITTTVTLVERAGHVEVSPIPEESAEMSVDAAAAMHVLRRTVPTNPGITRTVSRGEGWLEAHDSIRKITAICTAKS
jgi:hypothetical protein